MTFTTTGDDATTTHYLPMPLLLEGDGFHDRRIQVSENNDMTPEDLQDCLLRAYWLERDLECGSWDQLKECSAAGAWSGRFASWSPPSWETRSRLSGNSCSNW